MSIRVTAKAIIHHEGKVLLNRCFFTDTGEYYGLPGGGQNQYETMEEAIVRECLEETGYAVVPEAFVALYEEIFTHETVRRRDPNTSHKVWHVFRCRLADAKQADPTEMDTHQLGCVWMDVDRVPSLRLFPTLFAENLQRLVRTESPLYFGTRMNNLVVPT